MSSCSWARQWRPLSGRRELVALPGMLGVGMYENCVACSRRSGGKEVVKCFDVSVNRQNSDVCHRQGLL